MRRILVAPDSFKGSVSAAVAAEALADGWRSAAPGDSVVAVPLADGGEGTAEAVASASPGAVWHTVTGVRGPDDRPVSARWLECPDGTGVVELASSSGLPLMARPAPRRAHTYGLGQVIADALDHGVSRLVVGLGGSASTDGGTGALAALGARFLDASGAPLPLGGGALSDLARIDLSGLPPAPALTLLADVTAPLCGVDGAAAVFGPQKGATASDVEVLDAALARLASVLGGDPERPGAGAAGGAGYGLSVWGGVLVPGARTVADLVGLPSALAAADLVVTGEGRFDATSLGGKVVGHVLGVSPAPVVVVAGQLAAPAPPGSLALADLAGSVDAALADPVRWLVAAGRRAALACAP